MKLHLTRELSLSKKSSCRAVMASTSTENGDTPNSHTLGEPDMMKPGVISTPSEAQRSADVGKGSEEINNYLKKIKDLTDENRKMKSEMEMIQKDRDAKKRQVRAWRNKSQNLRDKLDECKKDMDLMHKRSLENYDEVVAKYEDEQQKVQGLKMTLALTQERLEEQTTVIEQMRTGHDAKSEKRELQVALATMTREKQSELITREEITRTGELGSQTSVNNKFTGDIKTVLAEEKGQCRAVDATDDANTKRLQQTNGFHLALRKNMERVGKMNDHLTTLTQSVEELIPELFSMSKKCEVQQHLIAVLVAKNAALEAEMSYLAFENVADENSSKFMLGATIIWALCREMEVKKSNGVIHRMNQQLGRLQQNQIELEKENQEKGYVIETLQRCQFETKKLKPNTTIREGALSERCEKINHLVNELTEYKRHANDLREELELRSREIKELSQSQRVQNVQIEKHVRDIMGLKEDNCQPKSQMETLQEHSEGLDRQVGIWRETARDFQLKLERTRIDMKAMHKTPPHRPSGSMARRNHGEVPTAIEGAASTKPGQVLIS